MNESKQELYTTPGIDLKVLDMLQESVALIGVYDQDENLRYANHAFRTAYFIEPDEQISWQTLMRRNFTLGRGTVIETDDIDKWILSVRSRRGKSRQRTYESDLHGGRFIWVTETMRDDGSIIYVGTDVTQLNVSERKLRLANETLFRQSFTDELTAVSNRRHILGKLQELLDTKQDAWACLLDIDYFKGINDTYGHQVGDTVLISIAHKARNTIRLKDSFGRVGGEEFLILLPGQALEVVKATLRYLQDIINVPTLVEKHRDLKVTISGGLTCLSPGDTQESVLRRADSGLYLAKNNGRAQIYLVKPEHEAGHPEVI